jgi:Domain of unknown function (DUF4349)
MMAALLLSAFIGTANAMPPPLPPSPAESSRAVAALSRQDARLVIRVNDREAALKQVVTLGQGAGGWFSSLSGESVTLRVPTAKLAAVTDQVRLLGDVVERSYESQDLSAEMADLQGRLSARQSVLDRYMTVLSTASAGSVVAVEREISRLISEIEGIEGRMRFLQDRADHAELQVSFVFRERTSPRRDGSSNFAWLNSVNLVDLLADVQGGRRASPSRLSAHAPAGFAAYKKGRRFQAVSPDDVVYRVRSVRNDPKADLAFWREALRTRMVDAGYHLLAEGDVTAGARTGALLELGAANGEQDQTYIVALFVEGRHLVLAEATGEATRVKGHRDAILAALSQLGN